MKTYNLEYTVGDKRHIGFVAEPENVTKNTPVILIVHMWSGRVPFVDEKAKDMASKGYIGFAIDMYGEGQIGQNVEENQALMQPFIENRAVMQNNIQAAMTAIQSIPNANFEKVVAMGYCFGGLCVQDLARVNKNVRGIISVHGLMLKAENIPQGIFQSRVLLLHGADDPMVSDADWKNLKQELDKAGCDWQKHDFGRVMHAFTNPEANDKEMGTVYNALADARSVLLIDNFIQECLS